MKTATIFDYLGTSAAVALRSDVDETIQRFWADTRDRHRLLQHDPDRPILPPGEIFLSSEEFFSLTHPHAVLSVRGKEPVDYARPLPDISVERGARSRWPACSSTCTTPHRVLLLAESEGRPRKPAGATARQQDRPPSCAGIEGLPGE